MQAMILRRPGAPERRPLEAADVPEPSPGRGEVLIAVEACGVCRTDLHILEGEVAARLPVIPGHQAVGTILQAASGVEWPREGDRVGVGWMAYVCRVCRFCRSGRENLCEKGAFTGRDRDGGYAAKMTARAEWVYPLPGDRAATETAPLLCAGIIGFRSLRLSGIQPGGRLGLFGFGAAAHLAIQVALDWKC